ncbi:MAG: hypothetical protein IPH50_03265 [Rhodanobacteraceae bacterium]|nr:hypothetical protein [Rhodanobacteraceae bacterium]
MKYRDHAEFTSHAATTRRGGVPVPVLALAGGLLASYLPMILPAGAAAGSSFLGWMLPLVFALAHLLMYLGRMKFPLMLWVPWIGWVAGYVVLSSAPNALQRGIMLVTPVIVGAAFSTLWVTPGLLDRIDRWITRFLWVFLAAAGIATGLLSKGTLYDTTNFAAGSITASLLACWFATRYVLMRNRRDLLLWLVMTAVPVLANTRTGMIAVALTLPLVLAPWSILRRLLLIAILPVIGLAIFQTDRIQKKMFYSGHGTIDEATTAVINMVTGGGHVDTDFATSGRSVLNDALRRARRGIFLRSWVQHHRSNLDAHNARRAPAQRLATPAIRIRADRHAVVRSHDTYPNMAWLACSTQHPDPAQHPYVRRNFCLPANGNFHVER